MKTRHRAYAYITHQNCLLLFTHPEAPESGIQVPAGTIKEGEDPRDGALREAMEETGLTGLKMVGFLGQDTRDMRDCGTEELQYRWFYHIACEETPPENWTHGEADETGRLIHPFDFFWASLKGGVPKLVANYDDYIPHLLAQGGILQGSDELEIGNGDQRWLTSWHPPNKIPPGRPHGSAGLCVVPTGELILVSSDGAIWDFPAGRPEGNETWEETLHREMLEEACALVINACLLGFCQSRCIEGPERDLVLVRAIWRVEVRLLDWCPQFEISHRKAVPEHEVIARTPLAYQPIWRRAFAEWAMGASFER